MGWGSATYIFDGAVDTTLGFVPRINDFHAQVVVAAVVERMYNNIDWEDWDTQDESKYFEPYLKNVMIANGEIDEEF